MNIITNKIDNNIILCTYYVVIKKNFKIKSTFFVCNQIRDQVCNVVLFGPWNSVYIVLCIGPVHQLELYSGNKVAIVSLESQKFQNSLTLFLSHQCRGFPQSTYIESTPPPLPTPPSNQTTAQPAASPLHRLDYSSVR